MTDESKIENTSRRKFLAGTAVAATGLLIVPRHVLGGTGYIAPSDRLNIAGIGVGGMGAHNIRALAGQNIVALCDVDWGYTQKSFRKMFAELGQAQSRVDRAQTAAKRRELQDEIALTIQLSRKFDSIKRYTDY